MGWEERWNEIAGRGGKERKIRWEGNLLTGQGKQSRNGVQYKDKIANRSILWSHGYFYMAAHNHQQNRIQDTINSSGLNCGSLDIL